MRVYEVRVVAQYSFTVEAEHEDEAFLAAEERVWDCSEEPVYVDVEEITDSEESDEE